jgi:co-chaperonin GroES (HSP10)
MKKTRKKLVAKWDKIIIQPLPQSEMSIAGFIIPDMGKETPEFGKVISVGPGVMNVFGKFLPNTSKVGDIVVIPRIGSFNFTFEGEDYFITREQELLAGIEEEEYEGD